MKTLMLMRHAKSDWEADFAHDHDRPLNARGRRAARQMGQWIATAGEVPDLVISSSAVRARSTIERAVAAGEWESEVTFTDRLYITGPRELLKLLRKTAGDAERVMLVGHETSMSDTVTMMSGGGQVRFPTGTVARIDLTIEKWAHAEPGCGRLVWLLPPRLIPADRS